MKNIPDFTAKDAKKLKAFLVAPERPEDTMDYFTLCGFLFAVTCAPDMVNPSEWLPIVFDDEDPGYKNLKDAELHAGLLFGLYNHINRQVLEGSPRLPDDCLLEIDPMSHFASLAPLSLWAQGFSIGHDWLEECWDEYFPEGLDEEMGAMMVILSFFSSRDLAEAFLKEAKVKDLTLEEMAGDMVEIFPEAMINYAELGRITWETVYEHSGGKEAVFKAEKVGRNEPCPCGSGKKYKKCCINKDATLHREDISELPSQCLSCHKSKPEIVDKNCNFCRDMDFKEEMLCRLNRSVQGGEAFECKAFRPMLKLAGTEKISSAEPVPEAAEESLLQSDSFKYKKAHALQRLKRNPDEKIIWLKYHLVFNTIQRRPFFKDIAKDAGKINLLFEDAGVEAEAITSIMFLAADHIHLYLESDGEKSLDSLVKELKVYSQRRLLLKFGKRFDKGNDIWDEAYFVETID